ncbi:hypothetical protein M422DRAFT_188714 [Sphaerobolus stellatus SS14]|uniref:Unplaced genomic scaffold SPHSTscaffold_211, whole genome shotgun sequence n=1 Tax=Sphaerobolus stellatus (strain SS14) TaxID=990650 RepID=A0A0C9UK86_SPHS4|nr:hypothetical protein M422DRAFT_188714 [Sphaerobolus stellatus SS14]
MSSKNPEPTHGEPDTEEYEDNPEVAATAVADTGESKLKMIMGLLKKCLGVKDIAAMRISLPASLLEPMPNLEYWQYLDRPDLFAAINDYDDPFLRMLAVLRFTFSKDLKFIRGKICKPYNSVLGEHFRAHWDIIPVDHIDPSEPPIQHLYVSLPAASSKTDLGTVKSAQTSRLSVMSAWGGFDNGSGNKSAETLSIKSSVSGKIANKGAAIGETNIEGEMSNLSLVESVYDAKTGELLEGGDVEVGDGKIRVIYLTEQVSHHPPISSYHMACPAKHITGSGVDQISAKVSGTTVRVAPGSHNKGIFLRIEGGPGEGERYQITHPTAQVNGFLRGSFYATLGDSTYITMTGGKSEVKYRAIIDYKEESWLGKAQFALEGVIYTYDEDETIHEEWTKVKHVPKDRVVAEFEGSWKHRIRWRKPLESEWKTLIDLSTLHVIPKSVRPLSKQTSNESRKLWEKVTTNLLKKEYNEATKYKLAIEQRQRDVAADRKKKGVEFQPVFFEKDFETGEVKLTPEGEKAVKAELDEISEDDELPTPRFNSDGQS